MTLRDLVLTFDVTDATAGATYELWLKVDGGAWALREVGAAETVEATQDFRLIALEPATAYSARLRMVLDGRYRSGYESSDPDAWPAESLLTFTTGGP